MPLPMPVLDDREFTDLMEEIRSLIPRYNPEWTNFNNSDPGITILELFAWLAEQTLYRANRIPVRNYVSFLKILGIELEEGESIESGVKRAREFLNERYRAVTEEDYRVLSLQKMEEIREGLGGRAVVMSNVNLDFILDGASFLADLESPGHISVILIPNCEAGSEYCDPTVLPWPSPTADLMADVKNFLLTRRLLTTSLHVVAPSYAHIDLTVRLRLEKFASASSVKENAVAMLQSFFHPLTGGSEGEGWPMGRSFYRSELYTLLEDVPGVDHVVDAFIDYEGSGVTSEAPILEWQLIALDNVTVEFVK